MAFAFLVVGVLTSLSVDAGRRHRARAKCLSAYGVTACGYDCKAAYGQVRCAETPEGVCQAGYGQLTCWEPDKKSVAFAGRGRERSECLTAYGVTTCGYDCKAAYGEVRCAETSEGVCEAGYGSVTCWEPQPARNLYPRQRYRKAECKSAYGRTVCGYDCQAAYGDVKCSQNRSGVCRAYQGQIECW